MMRDQFIDTLIGCIFVSIAEDRTPTVEAVDPHIVREATSRLATAMVISLLPKANPPVPVGDAGQSFMTEG